MPLPLVRPAANSTWYMAGCSSAIRPIQATSKSDRSQLSLNAAPAAALPTGAAQLRLKLNGGSRQISQPTRS